MRKFILALILNVVSLQSAAQVVHQINQSPTGQIIVRFINHNSFPVSCWYQDRFNFITFAINRNSSSMYYPVYGQFRWQCQ